MTTLLIHPGFPKSASTTIQKSIEAFQSNDHVSVFRSESAWPEYPTQASTHFRMAFDPTHLKPRSNPRQLSAETATRELAVFKSGKAGIKIISGEGISNLPPTGFAKAIDFFSPDRVEVRIVLRNPWDFQSSKLQQHIKTGATNLQVDALDYESRLRTFASYPTRLFSFEDLVKSGCITETIFPEAPVKDVHPQNVGFTGAGLAFIWRANLVEKHLGVSLSREDRNLIRRIGRELPGERFQLHPDDCNLSIESVPDYGFNWKEPDRPRTEYWKLSDFFRPLDRDAANAVSKIPTQLSWIIDKLSPEAQKNLAIVSEFSVSGIEQNDNLSS